MSFIAKFSQHKRAWIWRDFSSWNPDVRPSMEDEIEYNIDEAAAKLGKSRRWLETMLLEDSRKLPSERKLQHHYFIGRSKRWDESGYRALKAGIIEVSGASRSKTGTAPSTYQGPLPSAGNRSESERVLASLDQILRTGRSQKSAKTRRKHRQ